MPNWFNRPLRLPNVKHSVHDLSNDYKTSMNIGQLVPVYLEEMLPSDKFLTNKTEVFLRLAPLTFPLMHKIKIKTNDFFVPMRIIMGDDLYKAFLNGTANIPSCTFTYTTTETANPFVNSILDYLGCDVLSARKTVTESPFQWTFTIKNPVPFLAYFSIVRDWYLDSQLNELQFMAIDGFIEDFRNCMDLGQNMTISLNDSNPYLAKTFQVSYSKDYFNTARPQPQLGSEMKVLNSTRLGTSVSLAQTITGTDPLDGTAKFTDSGDITDAGGTKVSIYGYTDNDTTTIRDLWKKEQLQRFADASNSFGSRIREQLAAHFGVIISDKRLEIPAYCGGSTSYVNVSEVMQTSATESDSPLGSYGGAGKGFAFSQNKKYFCEEHGYYFTLLSLVPDNGYCRGQQRTFFKQNIFDFASPEFNNVGWQDVLNGEVFVAQTDADTQTWGYQPRYSEYRSHPSRCTGDFRQSSLLGWHLNRNYALCPPLNHQFLKVAGTDRIFNYEDMTGVMPIFVDVYNHVQVSRPISYEPDSMHLY